MKCTPALLLLSLTATVASAQLPELIYYKFDNPGMTVDNEAVPGVGAATATINGHSAGGTGQFGSGLLGVGGSSSTNYVDTGYVPALGGGDWTLSFWIDNRMNPAPTTLQYVFGDNTSGSWRIFTGGVAPVDGIIMRGPLTDHPIAGGAPASAPAVVHWVYDSVAGETRGYANGVFVNTVSQGPLNIVGSAALKVGGYSGSGCLQTNCLMDEVRLYDRALDAMEIAATWDMELGAGCSINSPAGMATVNGTVMVDYDTDDPSMMGAAVTASFEYSLDAGMTWLPATAGGMSMNPRTGIMTPATGLIFEWDTVADSVGVLMVETAEFRITIAPPMGMTATCEVNGLLVDNVPPPPTCTLAQTTPGTVNGVGSFDLTPDSMTAMAADATFEYSTDGGTTFLLATPAGTSTNPLVGAPLVTVSTFEWDSRADGIGLMAVVPGVIMRATVDDGTPLTGECLTMTFDVDNTALCQGICGDCDLNMLGPDILDALSAAQIAAGLSTPAMGQLACCDVNSSMSVEVLDALIIAQSAAGLPTMLMCL